MKWLIECLLQWRAKGLARFLLPELPTTGRILDVGSGTGHNAACLTALSPLIVLEADVVDMHSVGSGPVLFDGTKLPFRNAEFSAAIVLFVLQYADSPESLLKELRRVTAGRVLVLQSTFRGSFGYSILRTWEFLTGRCAFAVARSMGLVNGQSHSLRPKRFMTREAVRILFRASGFELRKMRPFDKISLCGMRTMYVLESIAP